MDAGDIAYASRDIADRLFKELQAKRLTVIGGDTVRAACAGFVADKTICDADFEHLFEASLRRIVQKCA